MWIVNATTYKMVRLKFGDLPKIRQTAKLINHVYGICLIKQCAIQQFQDDIHTQYRNVPMFRRVVVT